MVQSCKCWHLFVLFLLNGAVRKLVEDVLEVFVFLIHIHTNMYILKQCIANVYSEMII